MLSINNSYSQLLLFIGPNMCNLVGWFFFCCISKQIERGYSEEQGEP